MLSLGEMEFEFWERFSQIEEEDCSDGKLRALHDQKPKVINNNSL